MASLRKIMLNIGFEFAKVDGRKFLMERSDVSAAKYLVSTRYKGSETVVQEHCIFR